MKNENKNFIFKLPVWNAKEQIAKVILSSKISVIRSETGTGKSLVLPLILHALFPDKRIFVVEPRRIACTSLAKTLSDLGFDAGYQIRFEHDPQTKILYLTDGIAIRKLQTEENPIIILDEFHERRVDMDLILALIKNKAEKLIITSATIDLNIPNAVILDLEVPKRFPVIEKSVKPSENGYLETVVEQIVFHWNYRRILVFLPGIGEIMNVKKMLLQEMINKNLAGKTITVAHSTAGDSNFEDVIFSNIPAIILATNVAETSITPTNLDVVISSGMHRIMEYENGIEALVTKPIPISSFQQQKGRVGRTKSGLHIKITHREHPDYLKPEIERTNPDRLALILSYLKLDPKKLDWLTEPNWDELKKSYKFLKEINAMTESGILTEKGLFMYRIGVDPKFGHLLYEVSKKYPHLMTLAAALVAVLSDGDRFFVRPKDKQYEADERKKAFNLYNSDWASLINVLKRARLILKFGTYQDLRIWAFQNFIRYSALSDALREFHRLCAKLDLTREIPEIVKEDIDKLAEIMEPVAVKANRYYRWEYEAYVPKSDDAVYRVYIHPSSFLFGFRYDKVLAMTIKKTTKAYIVLSHPLD